MYRYATLAFVSFGLVLALVVGIALEAQGPSASQTGSFQLKGSAAPTPDKSEAPLELTASDGSGLRLVALDARAVVEPPLAFTELFLTFENPEDRVIEGRFRIALPPGAAISRFAMKIDGAWQEGEVVERQRARQVYEDFLHRRQDPALLEQEAGNEFSARVFPIPARGRKELAISYSHALPRADQPFVIPLLGLPEIERLDIRALLGERPAAGAGSSSLGGAISDRRMVELSRRDFKPDRDFEVTQDLVGDRAGLRHGNLVVARVKPAVPEEAQKIRGLYLLVDSSASRALGYDASARLAEELLVGLREGSRGAAAIGLAAFDQEVAPLFEGKAGDLGAAQFSALRERRPLGASDLGKTLGWLADRLERKGGAYPRVLVLTDGMATAGETDPAALKAAVRRLGDFGVERLDVLVAGGLRDEALLRSLVRGNLKHDGAVLDAGAPLEEIARRLTLASRARIEVSVPGASWVWPDALEGVQPGDQALIYADLPEGRPLEIRLDGRPAALGSIATVERPLLERQWVAARIDRLMHLRDSGNAGDQDLRRALTLQATELSLRHRVLSPLTAFLVLETQADYDRYGLDRKSLADILTVGSGGLEVLARSLPRERPEPLTTPPPKLVRREGGDRDGRAVVADEMTGQPVDVPEAEPQSEEAAETDLEAPAEEVEFGEGVGGVEGSVPGGNPGGVVGGVAGGVPGGVPGGTMAPPPPPPAAPRPATEPVSIPEAEPSPMRVGGEAEARRERQDSGRAQPTERRPEPPAVTAKLDSSAPYTGRFGEVMAALARGDKKEARRLAAEWQRAEPGDVLALLALGEACEANGETAEAARAYGSLIDLFPGRADLRRYAGERLERLGKAGLPLAADTYAKAAADRPDHPSGHRLLAWALARLGRWEEAFAAVEHGLQQKYPGDRFARVDQVMKEDLGLLAAAWLREQPGQRESVRERLAARGASLADKPSLRFVLSWETDANDVDLHVYDSVGGHAFYSERTLRSGGELYADVTTGYGPECFTLPLSAKRLGAPYRIGVDYYSRGPMGFGMGLLQVIEHDGRGGLVIEPRPFVVMVEKSMVDLGKVD